ncbi:MAG: hypothetical protein ACHQFW_10905 [Chitinophagales bacterium]
MDAGLTAFLITGMLAGFAGGLINIFLWMLAIRQKKIKLSDSFGNFIKDAANDPVNLNLKQIENKILNLFDDFMENKLTSKMPVLSMFIDDKLISEIRVVFHQEMENSLPALLEENMQTAVIDNSLGDILNHTLNKLIIKQRKRAIIYLLTGIVAGGVVGIVCWSLLK